MSTQGERLDLLTNASATGSAKVAQIGGRYVWGAVATFAGGSLQLQSIGPDGTTWVDVAGAVLTANGFVVVDVAQGANLRVAITGSPTAIYSTLVRVVQ